MRIDPAWEAGLESTVTSVIFKFETLIASALSSGNGLHRNMEEKEQHAALRFLVPETDLFRQPSGFCPICRTALQAHTGPRNDSFLLPSDRTSYDLIFFPTATTRKRVKMLFAQCQWARTSTVKTFTD